MPYIEIIWDLDDDPDGNVVLVAEHGLSKAEVEDVLRNPEDEGLSDSSGRPIVADHTRHGDLIAVIYEQADEIKVYPVTAYKLDD